MKPKSNPERYGTVAVSIHWLSAVLILSLLGSGFRAANATDAAIKAGFLRFHIPVAILALLSRSSAWYGGGGSI
jgi:cytochrome b561